MPYSLEHHLLFIHIPKTGGTSVEQALGMFGDWQVENKATLFGLIQDPDFLRRAWGSAFLQHLTFDEIHQVWSFPGAHVLCCVRNPWARFASVYQNLDTHLEQTAADLGIQLNGLTFPEFVDATHGLVHAHLRPQVDYLPSPSSVGQLIYLMRTESLARDFQEVCHELGLQLSLPWANRSPHREPWSKLYSLKTWDLIGERYHQDVKHFGYQHFMLSDL